MKQTRPSAMLAVVIGVTALHSANAEDRNAAVFDGLCNRCHGMKGEGMKGLEAPLIAGMDAWYVESQLRKFRQGLRGTHPQDMPGTRMRPMARSLYTDADVIGISTYVETMPVQISHPILTEANVEKGKTAYAPCVGCHGAKAEGNKMMQAPALAGQNDWYLFTQLKNFKAGIRGSNPTDATGAMMRGMAAPLDEATMRDISAYLGTLPMTKPAK
jgi:cytochrome c553